MIETGARFLLDPRQKHEPTLISSTAEGRSRRGDFLCRCIDIAKELNSDTVSFWSGVWRGDDESLAWQWLLDGCRRVTDYAERCGVQLAFEPEPGMLIETNEQYGRLAEQIGSPRFGLTIDIGHVQCVEDGSIADHLRRWAKPLSNVHIEDMRRGVHEHLRFGEGEIDFPPVMAAAPRDRIHRLRERRTQPAQPHGPRSAPRVVRVLVEVVMRLLFALLALICLSPSLRAEDFPPELVRFKQHGDKPVFAAAGQGTWEVKIRERGWIHLDPTADGTDSAKPKYRLWYTGYDGTREGIKRLGYATSADGVAWTRHKGNPIHTQHWVEDMSIVPHGGAFHMFAEGKDDQSQLLTSRDGVKWQRARPTRRSQGQW